MADEIWSRYKNHPTFVLGFHGCDADLARRVVTREDTLEPSEKLYDWLGSGVYFWEGSPHRAMEWAEKMASRPSTNPRRVKTPGVIGAIIDLGYCCNLLDSEILDGVLDIWDLMEQSGMEIPENKGDTPDKLGRYRDRAVIEFMHAARASRGMQPYDTVRSAFPEGGELFPGAGFTRRSHIQIAVRNPRCIKGYFLPIEDE